MAERFAVNDYVIYGKSGLCIIKEINICAWQTALWKNTIFLTLQQAILLPYMSLAAKNIWYQKCVTL